jgi:hypothetical protein
MATAHTFPLSLGHKSMEYIFGEDAEDEINKARNGLFLPPLVLSNRKTIMLVVFKKNVLPQSRSLHKIPSRYNVLVRGADINVSSIKALGPRRALGVNRHTELLFLL